jgi:uncharacterized surface protein with fasciclin (FAS1) repeats
MRVISFLVLMFSLAFAAENRTILEIALETAPLSELVKLVSNYSDIVSLLNSTAQNITVFAPVNSAWPANASASRAALQYHVIASVPTFKEGMNYVQSADSGYYLKIKKTSDGVEVNFGVPTEVATVTQTVQASNGVVHLVDKVLAAPDTLANVEEAAGLSNFSYYSAEILAGDTNITIFGPKDAAFAGLTIGSYSKQAAEATIKYHVVKGTHFLGDINGTTVFNTLEGDNITVKNEGGTVSVNGATIVSGDMLSTTAVVHSIDKVLPVPWRPEESLMDNIVRQGEYSVLAALASNSPPVLSILSNRAINKTLFAPNNAALLAANASGLPVATLTSVLEYHLVQGAKVTSGDLEPLQFVPSSLADPRLGSDKTQVLKVAKTDGAVTVNAATVNDPNLMASDAVVHGVDAVIAIPADTVTVANASGLNTLIELVVLANLTSAVLETPHITIFAPDDVGFKTYLESIGETISTINASVVQSLLLEHVVGATLYSTALAGEANVTSLNNKTWSVSGNGTKIDEANVLTANVLIKNGVVHVIDRVLGGPAPPTPEPSSSGLSAGEVVAIVVGVLAGVAIIGYCCFRSSKKDDDYVGI